MCDTVSSQDHVSPVREWPGHGSASLGSQLPIVRYRSFMFKTMCLACSMLKANCSTFVRQLAYSSFGVQRVLLLPLPLFPGMLHTQLFGHPPYSSCESPANKWTMPLVKRCTILLDARTGQSNTSTVTVL